MVRLCARLVWTALNQGRGRRHVGLDSAKAVSSGSYCLPPAVSLPLSPSRCLPRSLSSTPLSTSICRLFFSKTMRFIIMVHHRTFLMTDDVSGTLTGSTLSSTHKPSFLSASTCILTSPMLSRQRRRTSPTSSTMPLSLPLLSRVLSAPPPRLSITSLKQSPTTVSLVCLVFHSFFFTLFSPFYDHF